MFWSYEVTSHQICFHPSTSLHETLTRHCSKIKHSENIKCWWTGLDFLQSSRLSLLIDLKQRPVTLKWRHLIGGHHTLTYLAEGACIFKPEKTASIPLYVHLCGALGLEAKWNTSPHFSLPWSSNRDGLTEKITIQLWEIYKSKEIQILVSFHTRLYFR